MNTNFIQKGWLGRFAIFFLLVLLTGCSNDYAEEIKENYGLVAQNLKILEKKLINKELVNSKIVDIYATKLANIKPDFAPIAEAMSKDATEQGMLYKNLVGRLDKVNQNPENKKEFEIAQESLSSIDVGADPVVFNDALIDLINTMAELSAGQLETVSVPKESQAAHARGEAITPGSYLVGNPGYGEYRRDNSGSSLWHWYGQYSFFNSVSRAFSGGRYNRSPISYDRWNSRSHYSYYNDYGRRSYGSGRDRSSTSRRNTRMRDTGLIPAKPKKQYGSAKGRQRMSSYGKQRKMQSNHFKQKKGSTNKGARHAGKVGKFGKSGTKKRTSSFVGNKSKSTRSRTVRSPSKRSSSFFGSSSRSRRSFGGK